MKHKRSIIKIDEELCNGCGACVEGCHEGALQVIEGKARIVSELYCDGLGACIGECPLGAIEIEERQAEAYNERAVMERIAPKGEDTILAHLKHLKEHGELLYFREGIEFLEEHHIVIDLSSIQTPSSPKNEMPKLACGCPGSMERSFVAEGLSREGLRPVSSSSPLTSALTHWPVQLHLVNPNASFFQKADVLLAADCTAFAYPDFHNRFMRNHALVIACPKLDEGQDIYIAKLVAMINDAQINTLQVVIMEVPCCGGLLQLAKTAVQQAQRKVPIKKIVIGVQGEVKEEDWV
ncbi:MAG: ATP-binding protein [Bacteroidales bacterium]